MTQPTTAPVDLTAILTALQDQIDDLTATIEAQQQRLDTLEARLRATETVRDGQG